MKTFKQFLKEDDAKKKVEKNIKELDINLQNIESLKKQRERLLNKRDISDYDRNRINDIDLELQKRNSVITDLKNQIASMYNTFEKGFLGASPLLSAPLRVLSYFGKKAIKKHFG